MTVRAAGPSGKFEVRCASGSDTGELLIYGDIGESFWAEESVTAHQVVADLESLEADYLTVRINSGGGSVHDALAIYNAIKRHKSAVTVEIDGLAASAASMIAMAGDTVNAAENALLMVHAPWAALAGNAVQHREAAEMLDKHADAMATAYVRGSITLPDVLALLKDGADHWFTAAEAVDFGFVDNATSEIQVAASINRFNHAAVAASTTEAEMPKTNETTGDNLANIQDAADKKAADKLRARNHDIKNAYTLMMDRDGVAELYAQQISDPDTTLEQAQKALLAHIADDEPPVAGPSIRAEVVADERDKFREGAAAVVDARMGGAPAARTNHFRGFSLHEIGAKALSLAGVDVSGMTKREIAGKIFAANVTSDFPLLLMDAANKSLQTAYEAFPSTWSQVAAVGQVSDFKTVNLIRMGSFSSLDTKAEGADYTEGTISEESETLTPITKGKYIQLSREMIINDDLSGFSRMAMMLGRAAARTVNKDVYSLITTNGVMGDGEAIFSAAHANTLAVGTVLSVAEISAARAAMRMQLDPSGEDYLNIMPRTLLVPVVLEDTAREIVNSTDNTDVTSSRKKNPIREWGPLEVVSDPYLDAVSATGWYLVSDPMDAPLIEVHFLDGNQTPFIDTDEEFLSDAIQWKVRLDYGLAANDYRGGYFNPGA